MFCFKEHLQWVVCDAPNRPPENPHPGGTLRLPGVRLHQVRLTSLFDQKSLSDGNIFLYSQSPRPASVCSDPLCSSHPPFQELHELSQSPRENDFFSIQNPSYHICAVHPVEVAATRGGEVGWEFLWTIGIIGVEAE